MNATVAVWVIVVESVESVAVDLTDSAIVSLTLKVTTPELLEVPEAAPMLACEVPPPDNACASVTVLPETGLPAASFSVTVMVVVAPPSVVTLLLPAVTVELPAVTAPAETVAARCYHSRKSFPFRR